MKNSKETRIFQTILIGVCSVLTCMTMTSCSISHSSKSFSDSSSSICTSSSGEELSEDKKQSYMNEVMIFTDSMVHTRVTSEDFMRGIARIAERYGVTNWEFFKETYIAIGKGLKHAGVKKEEIDTLPILEGMTGPRTTMKKYILEGYDSM